MPASLDSSVVLVKRLHRYLDAAFPSATAKVHEWQNTSNPLLILETQSELAGFAVCNGVGVPACYENSYRDFKRVCFENESAWEALNMSFVLCTQAADDHLDQFRSEVETDVYFCRKFVISFEKELERALARLPFIPLHQTTGACRRPASAQTLLQQGGTPAALARVIVHPQDRSPEGIVDDCVANRFGSPKFTLGSNERTTSISDSVSPPVRIKSVEITNFRAYRRSQEFDLDADLVVLYGPNGFGKTSLFDAIDFASTGEIGRLDIADEKRFQRAAAHLDAPLSKSVVAIKVQQNGTTHEIARTVERRKTAQFDNVEADRKTILTSLTGAMHADTVGHLGNLISLFRATHLFSQEAQELAKDFSDQCELRSDVISRMLAFEDYTNAIKKVQGVIGVIDSRLHDREAELSRLSTSLEEDHRQVDEFEKRQKSIASPAAAASVTAEVVRLLSAAGLTVASDEPDISMVRGWRALLEAAAEQGRLKKGRLVSAQATASEAKSLKLQIAARTAELAAKNVEATSGAKVLAELEAKLRETVSAVDPLAARGTSLSERKATLARLRGAKPVYDEACRVEFRLTADIVPLAVRRATTAAKVTEEVQRLREAEAHRQRIIKEISSTRNLTEIATVLVARVRDWQSNVVRIRELETARTESARRVTAVQKEAEVITAAAHEAVANEQRIAAQLQQLEARETELQTLIASLEPYALGVECPVCGVEHASPQELKRRIRSRREPTPAVDAIRSDRRKAAEHVAVLRTKVSELRLIVRQESQIADNAAQELQRLSAERTLFETQLSELGIEASETEVAALVSARQIALQRQQAELDEKLRQQTAAMETISRRIEAARTTATEAEIIVKEKERELVATHANLQELRSLAASSSMSLAIEAGDLVKLESEATAALEEVQAALKVASAAVDEVRAATNVEKKRLKGLSMEIRATERELASLRATLLRLEKDLELLGLNSDSTDEQMTLLIDQQSRLDSAITVAREATLALEMALDAAATSAAIAGLKTRIHSSEVSSAAIRQVINAHQPWREYFVSVAEALEKERADAVHSYAAGCGPRTSVIQQRLRSVYGFGDIELSSRGSNIAVRVMRNGQQLHPTDYFSQSQTQILMLSIFLTTCSTQTWSAFSPVMLDDPVTHFDDLNSYAFLDLLVGLLESGLQRRQFIISTCEERLFQLTRQKFQHLGNRAKFYSFSSTGRDGPVVDPCPSSEE
jgi:exonuclease SbcC